MKKKILLIGLDSADWEIIRPLMNAGMMPGIKSLIENGASGNIKTLHPSFSPLLWTSVATGKLADKHNILGFLEPDEKGEGVRPVSVMSRKARAVWNILQSQNYACNVIGWWPSHPAEPLSGLMVSNRFHKYDNNIEDAIPEGAVWPLSLREQVKKLRVHSSQIGADQVKVFVPEAARVNQDGDTRLQVIRTLMAEAVSVFNTTLWALENTAWDFTAVYFNELDVFSHHFMKFHPPQLQGIPDELYQLYYNVITAAYTMYDAMLQKILKTIPADTTVLLTSDHGFYSGEKRLKKIPAFAGAIALEHNPYGVFCIKGPGIKKNETIYGADLLDITPTLLTIAGLPAGEDMDGQVLNDIFSQQPEATTICSWEDIEGSFGTHAPGSYRDTFSEAEAMQQLIDLGYIEQLNTDAEAQIISAINERHYNLSLVYASSGRIKDALKLVEVLYTKDRVDLRYNLDLIRYYLLIKNFGKAREILSNFKKFDISGLPNFNHLEGKIYYAENNKNEALHCYQRAMEQSSDFVQLILDTANTWADLGNMAKAVAAYKKVLARDPENIDAFIGLAMQSNNAGRYEEAISFALDVLKIERAHPLAHHCIGVALFQSEEYEAAAQALENCLRLHPEMRRARNLLLRIYKKHLPLPEKFENHYRIFSDARKGEIVIVSGLPRSGTSLMMQMLMNGGMEVLSDHKVQADEHNPKGYLEYEPVKKSKADIAWLEHADGKAVKVISRLLPYLKMKYHLKIIFMERDLHEVIMSQQVMIASRKNIPVTFDMRLKETYANHMKEALEWAENNNHVEYVRVNFKDAIESPAAVALRVNDFLGGFLDEEKMTASTDSKLYRTKYYEQAQKSA